MDIVHKGDLIPQGDFGDKLDLSAASVKMPIEK